LALRRMFMPSAYAEASLPSRLIPRAKPLLP
jgi:hypothetical protein